jgi:hypothetical protein
MRVLIVVRRGATDRFQFLKEQFAAEPVEVIWDRRVTERRQRARSATVDRRSRERREAIEEDFAEPARDRRLAERRARAEPRLPERRVGDRRHAPPSSWTALDFVVVGASG